MSIGGFLPRSVIESGIRAWLEGGFAAYHLNLVYRILRTQVLRPSLDVLRKRPVLAVWTGMS
jgi:hypothetical protein